MCTSLEIGINGPTVGAGATEYEAGAAAIPTAGLAMAALPYAGAYEAAP